MILLVIIFNYILLSLLITFIHYLISIGLIFLYNNLYLSIIKNLLFIS